MKIEMQRQSNFRQKTPWANEFANYFTSSWFTNIIFLLQY